MMNERNVIAVVSQERRENKEFDNKPIKEIACRLKEAEIVRITIVLQQNGHDPAISVRQIGDWRPISRAVGV